MRREIIGVYDEAVGIGFRLLIGSAAAASVALLLMQPWLHMPDMMRLVSVALLCLCISCWAIGGSFRRTTASGGRGAAAKVMIFAGVFLTIYAVAFISLIVSIVFFYYLP